MPTIDVLERDWEKAIEIVRRDYPDVKVGSAEFWAIVFGVVKRMRGRKSIRHLKAILEKARPYEPLSFLPFALGTKVRGTDLWLDLPPHLAKEPPSSYPSLPLRRSALIDQVKAQIKGDLNEFVEKVLDRYVERPIGVSVDSIAPLLTGSLVLYETPKVPEDEEVSWKLMWVYGMCAGDIQPVTPRWGYRLAQMSAKMRDLVLKRINEHISVSPLRDPLSFVPDVVAHEPTVRPFVIISPSELNSVAAILPYEWTDAKDAASLWSAVKRLIGNIIPAYFAYVLDVAGLYNLRDIKFVAPNAIDANKVLCAFTDERLAGAPPFPVFRLPENSDEFKLNIRISLRRSPAKQTSFMDEIRATLSPKWI